MKNRAKIVIKNVTDEEKGNYFLSAAYFVPAGAEISSPNSQKNSRKFAITHKKIEL